MKRRNQNQKFPSFQIFRFAAGGVGGAANKNDRKFLGFAPRELVERGRGADRIIRQNPANFVRNTFELRPIHTAKMSKSGLRFAEANLRCDEICQEIREDDIRREIKHYVYTTSCELLPLRDTQ